MESFNKDPKNNAKDTTSSLSAFIGENSITISELNATLDTYKVKVLVLEDQLKKQRNQMEDEFNQ
jgi:hypothetical protein